MPAETKKKTWQGDHQNTTTRKQTLAHASKNNITRPRYWQIK